MFFFEVEICTERVPDPLYNPARGGPTEVRCNQPVAVLATMPNGQHMLGDPRPSPKGWGQTICEQALAKHIDAKAVLDGRCRRAQKMVNMRRVLSQTGRICKLHTVKKQIIAQIDEIKKDRELQLGNLEEINKDYALQVANLEEVDKRIALVQKEPIPDEYR